MAGHAGIVQAGPMTFLHQRIAVTDAAGLDFDPHPAGGGLGNFTFNDFKRPVWTGDLGGTHLWHSLLRSPLLEAREFVEVTELTPLRHNEVVVHVNRSAVGRVADAVLPFVLGEAEVGALVRNGVVADLRDDIATLVQNSDPALQLGN